MDILLILYSLFLFVLSLFSYGFVDKNLVLSQNWLYRYVHAPLQVLAFERRGYAGFLYICLIGSLFLLYYLLLKKIENGKYSVFKLKRLLVVSSMILLFGFPAFSYDLFNYITTAKVTFTYHENPWIVMPNEIPNEPSLAYTRASNKVALYGPTWIFLSSLPSYMSFNSPWLSILTFKGVIVAFYFAMIIILFKYCKDPWVVAFFGLNPLVLIEVLLEGHNDIVMMVLAVLGSILFLKNGNRNKLFGVIFWLLSVLVKGATVILLPLFFIKSSIVKKFWLLGLGLLSFVFLLSPLREEMYPWYAIWMLSFLVFLDKKKYKTFFAFFGVLSFGLLLRNAPYIVSREYSGWNQIARTILTVIPPVLFVLWNLVNSRKAEFKKHL